MMSSINSQLAVVLDVGTTNIKVFVFSSELKELFSKQEYITTTHPKKDWAEQDPNHILTVCKRLLKAAYTHVGKAPARVGITNQRESVLAWDKATGKALSPLILWSDKRTDRFCKQLKERGIEDIVRYKTGLMLTPYSSATKINWLLQQPRVQSCKSLAIGTVDSWLVFKLTGEYLTDYTNASRTMLYNIHTQTWDEALLNTFGVKREFLARVVMSQANFGSYKPTHNQSNHPILAVIGDQQASMYAVGAAPGTTKVTYGTGIFPMRILGDIFELKDNYLTTLAIGSDGRPVYALEGKVENAGPRVTEVYNVDKPAFDKLMLKLAHEAAPVISGLTNSGEMVYVDGGISQNNDILAEQERINHITTKRLETYNGSALGVAKLLFSAK